MLDLLVFEILFTFISETICASEASAVFGLLDVHALGLTLSVVIVLIFFWHHIDCDNVHRFNDLVFLRLYCWSSELTALHR